MKIPVKVFALLACGAVPVCPGLAGVALAQVSNQGGNSDWSAEAERVFACRQIADADDKLACFEREVAALETAVRGREVLVLDREDVREARRGLFGFNLPNIALFGKEANEERRDEDASAGKKSRGDVEDVDRLEARLTDARETGQGRWELVLDTGARWAQTDRTPVLRQPRAGDSVVIRKAALGSYMVSIEGARAFRVRRVE